METVNIVLLAGCLISLIAIFFMIDWHFSKIRKKIDGLSLILCIDKVIDPDEVHVDIEKLNNGRVSIEELSYINLKNSVL